MLSSCHSRKNSHRELDTSFRWNNMEFYALGIFIQ
jgi:hypothetical protein